MQSEIEFEVFLSFSAITPLRLEESDMTKQNIIAKGQNLVIYSHLSLFCELRDFEYI